MYHIITNPLLLYITRQVGGWLAFMGHSSTMLAHARLPDDGSPKFSLLRLAAEAAAPSQVVDRLRVVLGLSLAQTSYVL